jgi:hypothetical protein
MAPEIVRKIKYSFEVDICDISKTIMKIKMIKLFD